MWKRTHLSLLFGTVSEAVPRVLKAVRLCPTISLNINVNWNEIPCSAEKPSKAEKSGFSDMLRMCIVITRPCREKLQKWKGSDS